MKFTATELSRNPNKVFRAAYDAKGEPVTIVHGQYSEGFEIRLKQSEHAINSNDAHKDKAVEIGLRMLEKGNVIITGGGKYVIKTPRILEPAETFVCDSPHQDEDFSYLCGSDYCRCCQ